jgi:3-hydroxyacyl-CoA dehydrogenase
MPLRTAGTVTARPVHLAVRDGVAVAVIDHPPVNALSHVVRAGLWAALDAVEADPALRGLVIRAEGRTWPPGADIREFDAPPKPPILGELCDRIDGFAKPVVVILHGTVLGGGLELALAARARLARPGTTFGLPEVTLGLCPGAGGTRRLPALIGAKAALGLMLTGLPVAVGAAEGMGLIDAVVEDDAEAVAAELVRTLAAEGPRPPQARHADAAAWMAAVAEARAGLREARLPAPARIIGCVEAALLLPPEAAGRFERAAFTDLAATPQSRALRHAFFAERRAGRADAPAAAGAKPPERVALLGAGDEVARIAAALAAAGAGVTLIPPVPEDGLAGHVAEAGAALEASGRLPPGGWARLSGRIAVTGVPGAVAGCDAALALDAEAAALAALLPAPGPIVIRDLAEAEGFRAAVPELAGRTFGLAPLPTPASGRVAELTAPPVADPAALGAAIAFVRRMDRTAVVTRAPAGPALIAAFWAAADRAVGDGASPYQVDRALTGWGFARGPFAIRDRLGLDRAPPPQGPVTEALWLALMESGRIGAVTGAGFYLHPQGGAAAEDPALAAMLDAARVRAGQVPRAVEDDEIALTTLAALAVAGARLVERGAVARPSDIDVLAMGALGFPRWRGGPMQATDEAGVLSMRNLLRDLARDGGEFWVPGTIWDDLIRNGQRFADLNA